MLQRVQNRAVRWVCGVSPKAQISVSQLARDLHWPTLEQRRKDQRLCLMYKIVHGEVAITPEHLGLKASDGRTRASRKHKFREHQARTENLRHSFVNSTVRIWNTLPATLAEADSATTFKSRLVAMLD